MQTYKFRVTPCLLRQVLARFRGASDLLCLVGVFTLYLCSHDLLDRLDPAIQNGPPARAAETQDWQATGGASEPLRLTLAGR